MREEEIVEFVRKNIEPFPPLPFSGPRYRVAGTMTDGTHLPCIVVESAALRVNLAVRRFAEAKDSTHLHTNYRAMVATFVSKGNTISEHDIAELSVSPHAIPPALVREIGGETAMGWTEFHAIMNDGKEFCFGTQFIMEFFAMPQGYSATDIEKIIPAIRGEDARQERVYREKPFFTCYVNGL